MIKTAAYQPKNEIWEMPFLPPIATEIVGVKEPCQRISNRAQGEWMFRMASIENIPDPYDKSQDFDFSCIKDGWEDIIVPSSLIMQGYNIKNNTEYYYKKTIHVADMGKDLRVFVRFEGVYCNARIWLGGKYICTHIGGFTPFDIEISDYLNEQNCCEIVIGIADIEGKNIGIWNSGGASMSDASWGSYYAHNNICGILRNVSVYCLPKTFLLSNHIKADLTDNYTKGQLALDMTFACANIGELGFIISLVDEIGNLVFNQSVSACQCAKIQSEQYTKSFDIDINSHQYQNIINKEKDLKFSQKYIPFERCTIKQDLFGLSITCSPIEVMPWTAEIPKLYTLSLEIIQNGESICVYTEQVGFRSLEYGGAGGKDKNKLFVNGKEIKLRGVCRHDISSKYGRSLTEDEEKDEVLSFKNNNINHVRTSHYPASKHYLQLCDKYGIYVEQECSVCFKGGNGYNMLCAPEEILQNFSEMVEYYYNHPSIIMWSTGNESGFEKSVAFRRSYEYAKEKDKGRPTIFSYPKTVKSKPLPYDIYSKHYMKVTKFLGNKKFPKLHDEFAHVACYNLDDLVDDNNYRLAWGKSIMRGWDNIIDDDGALGCAIWGGIDDVFYLPKGVDSAHQRHSSMQAVGYGEWGAVLDVYKREKPEAYLTKKAFSPIKMKSYSLKGGNLTMKIHNRFDHVNLSYILCVVNDCDGNCLFSGNLPCDIAAKRVGEVVLKLSSGALKDVDVSFYFDGRLVEREVLCAAKVASVAEGDKAATYEVVGSDTRMQLRVGDSAIVSNLTFMRNAKPKKAKHRSVTAVEKSKNKKLVVVDKFNSFNKVKYTFESLPEGVLVDVKLSPMLRYCIGERFAVGLDIGGNVKAVSWDKNCDFSCYPEGHLERSIGVANVAPEKPNAYGVKPEQPWKEDGYNYFTGISSESERVFVTNDFKTTRTDINNYLVEMDGAALRVQKVNEVINCYTSYTQEKIYFEACNNKIIKSGSWRLIRKNTMKQCMVSRKKGSVMSIDFTGIGIKIVGTRSKEQGKISLYIDDIYCKTVDTRSDICDVLDFMVLDTISDLSDGKHKLSIVLNDNDGVRISGFEVIPSDSAMIKSRLSVGVGDYYRSLAWGNYYGKRMTIKQKKGFSFLLTPYKN